MIPAWVAPWVGLEYESKGRGPDRWDCWGLVRGALASHGILTPDYSEAYTDASNMESASRAIRRGLEDGWVKVSMPEPLDLVILNIAKGPWHCGLMVTKRDFLHIPPPDRKGIQHLSCIEAIDGIQWEKRIGGFWRRSVNP